jgi:hypothetical protein
VAISIILLVGILFQIRMWREVHEETQGESRPSGFYPFGLAFCCVMEALAAHSYFSSRFDSRKWSSLPTFCRDPSEKTAIPRSDHNEACWLG